MSNWFQITDTSQLDTPALAIYKERVEQNINEMLRIVNNDPTRLMPHVKTNKMVNIIKMMIDAGITRFKCATIAEAELVALAGGKQVLIAHQLMGFKLQRLKNLIEKYPTIQFSPLIDCVQVLEEIETVFSAESPLAVYIDVNNGMNRSGIEVENLASFHLIVSNSAACKLKGWHVYDGHIREETFSERKKQVKNGFEEIERLFQKIASPELEIIAGGSPAFTCHALESNRICSPGTSIFWDWGYGDRFTEQNFKPAAVILTRIISKPAKGLITVDMGHKAVASENPIDKRIRFLNLSDYELLSQSEEHGVVKVENWDSLKVGDMLYGIPYHVCPSVNLYDEAYIIENQEQTAIWRIEGRKRKINV